MRTEQQKTSAQKTLDRYLARRNNKGSAFYRWFCTFLEEKGIDLSLPINDRLQVGDVCQAICDTSPEEQKAIQHTLVMIDFKNGNVYHYFNHLAQAL